jgi:hypothetical protein
MATCFIERGEGDLLEILMKNLFEEGFQVSNEAVAPPMGTRLKLLCEVQDVGVEPQTLPVGRYEVGRMITRDGSTYTMVLIPEDDRDPIYICVARGHGDSIYNLDWTDQDVFEF